MLDSITIRHSNPPRFGPMWPALRDLTRRGPMHVVHDQHMLAPSLNCLQSLITAFCGILPESRFIEWIRVFRLLGGGALPSSNAYNRLTGNSRRVSTPMNQPSRCSLSSMLFVGCWTMLYPHTALLPNRSAQRERASRLSSECADRHSRCGGNRQEWPASRGAS